MKKLLFPILVLLLSSLVLFKNLGNHTLNPWDEAWYGSIAKNMLKSGNYLEMTFNNENYWDHPPLGFWSIATSYKILGINDFNTRLPMAFMGVLAILSLYYAGKTLSSESVGFASALILLSCRWFLMRARSGNLEMPLLLFQILAFLFAYKGKSIKNIALSWLFLSLALLSKSAISLTLLPIVFLSTVIYIYNLKFKPKKLLLLALAISLALLPLLPWYLHNYNEFGKQFLQRNILQIGLRNTSASGVSSDSINKTLLFLRSAIHKWYLPLLFSTLLSFVFIKSRPIRWTLLYLLLSSFPYFISSQTEIWHLLPMFPPAALLISLVASHLISLMSPKHLRVYSLSLFTLGIVYITFISLRSYYPDIINTPKTVSHEARLAIESTKYPYRLVIQDNTYIPTVIYYADQYVEYSEYKDVIDREPRPFQLISREHQLKQFTNYEIVSQSGDTYLALFK